MARLDGRSKRIIQVARSYGFSVSKVRPYSSLYKKFAAFRISTKRGDYMVKPFTGSQSQLIRLSSYAARLHTRGFHGMPKWLKTPRGKMWVKKNGTLYYVTEWINGNRISGTEEELAKLGEVLATLHTVSRSLKLKSTSDSTAQKLRKQYHAFCRQLKALRKESTKAGTWFQNKGDDCLKLSREALDALELNRIRSKLLKESRRPPLIHGDVTIPNALNSKEHIYLIDWDLMNQGSSYLDLVKALTNTAGFNPSNMASFLRGYEKVRPFTRSEKKLISALYRIPREAWYVSKKAFAGRNYEQLLAIVDRSWNERMEAIRWMDTWSQQ